MILVTNVRFLNQNWRNNSAYVFIGRGTVFGNPKPLTCEIDRESNLAEYKIYVEERVKHDSQFREALQKLYGKILVCFCKPKQCHGDILVELAMRITDGESSA
jgi:hypothetical protein